jgi:LmbE family N-acetylglucosaminyl deacetylase
MNSRIKALLQKIYAAWGRVMLIILGLAAVGFVTWLLASSSTSIPVADLHPLPLAGYQRLLILAPHCDDETLGSAGLILAAQRAGIQVRVVIATNGDGFLFATMQDFRKVYPSHADFIRMGEERQQESLAALAKLGVKADQVTFLSYPDRGTPALWNAYWSPGSPYRSPYSGDSRSPYPLTYNPQSVYAGADYLADLTSILESYRPDLVVYPNPDDVHPDHWGLNVFTRLALTRMRHNDPSYTPTELTYLVHRPDFPEPRGYIQTASLTPPDMLYALDPHWYRLDLAPADEVLKGQAVQAYRSQLPLLHSLLDSFVRTNEIFDSVTTPNLATAAQGDPLNPSTWRDATGQLIKPVQLDPVGDIFTRTVVPAGDLTAVYAARNPQDDLLLCMQVREDALPAIIYSFRLKALTDSGSGIIALQSTSGRRHTGELALQRSGVYACTSLPLAQLGDPWAVYVGANTVTGGRVLDEAGWQMITLDR